MHPGLECSLLNTGVVSARSSLHHTAMRTSYRLEMVASDEGDPVMSPSTSLTLTSSADSLHSPEFSDVSTQIIIHENEPVDTSIIKLSPSNLGTWKIGMLCYSIHLTDVNTKFF